MAAFRGSLWFCSNFYPAECWYDGDKYPTSEHAFAAAKTLDKSKRIAIMNAKTPGEAKRLGRKLDIRPDWNEIRIDIMYQILISKFQDKVLRAKLLDTFKTHPELVEVNEWGDVFWGQCPAGNGENNLGKILMRIRHEIRDIEEILKAENES